MPTLAVFQLYRGIKLSHNFTHMYMIVSYVAMVNPY